VRRFIVKYYGREYECVLFSDGEVYIHGSSIVPAEFDNLQDFRDFVKAYADDSIKWIDTEEEGT